MDAVSSWPTESDATLVSSAGTGPVPEPDRYRHRYRHQYRDRYRHRYRSVKPHSAHQPRQQACSLILILILTVPDIYWYDTGMERFSD